MVNVELLQTISLLIYSSLGIGIHLTLFLQCFYLLLHDKTGQRSNYLLLTFICFTFIIGTLYIASEAIITQDTLIDSASIPGGPIAFYLTEARLPVQKLDNFVVNFGNWMCGCLLVSHIISTFPN